MRSSYVSLAFAALLAAACGGKVAIDQASAAGGAGGSSTTTITATTGTSTTSTSTSSTSTSSGACGLLAVPPACEACATSNCCAQISACDVGTTCWQELMCLADCASEGPNCQANCNANDLAVGSFISCLNNECGSAQGCNNPGADICDSGLTAPQGSGCAVCLTLGCCSAYEACSQDPLCMKCLSVPDAPPDCFQSKAFAAADTCRKKLCPHACK